MAVTDTSGAPGQPGPPARSPRPRTRSRRRLIGDEAGVVLVLVLLVTVVGIYNSDYLKTGNLLETARQEFNRQVNEAHGWHHALDPHFHPCNDHQRNGMTHRMNHEERQANLLKAFAF